MRWHLAASAGLPALLLLAGCGGITTGAATPQTGSRPPATSSDHAPHLSSIPSTSTAPRSTTVAAGGTHVMTVGQLSIRVPTGWTLGQPVTLRKVAAAGGNVIDLMPIRFPSSIPGITTAAEKKSPFFSESLVSSNGHRVFQLEELSDTGNFYTLQVTAPSRQQGELKAAIDSLRIPPLATVTQDVHWIQTRPPAPSMLDIQTAQVGRADRWMLASGDASLAWEPFALYRSTDGGRRWTLISHTKPLRYGFLGHAGRANLLFWNAHDGIVVDASSFTTHLTIEYTTDGGTTWRHAQVPPLGRLKGRTSPVITRPSPDTLTVTTTVYPSKTITVKSINGGKTWATVSASS